MTVELIFIFLLIAILYSSIGFGGGSSYLAILSLYAFDQSEMKLIALICNITVVLGASILYYRKGLINFNKMLPLILLSVPLSFLGGKIVLPKEVFLTLLGIVLIMAGVLILIRNDANYNQSNSITRHDNIKNAGIGGVVGFISGLVGIGGGIFLSPILYLQRWDSPKIIAATSSLFILVNSVAGILGNISNGIPNVNWMLVLALIITVLLGGQIGTRLSILKLKGIWIKKATGLLILIIGFKIVIKIILK